MYPAAAVGHGEGSWCYIRAGVQGTPSSWIWTILWLQKIIRNTFPKIEKAHSWCLKLEIPDGTATIFHGQFLLQSRLINYKIEGFVCSSGIIWRKQNQNQHTSTFVKRDWVSIYYVGESWNGITVLAWMRLGPNDAETAATASWMKGVSGPYVSKIHSFRV